MKKDFKDLEDFLRDARPKDIDATTLRKKVWQKIINAQRQRRKVRLPGCLCHDSQYTGAVTTSLNVNCNLRVSKRVQISADGQSSRHCLGALCHCICLNPNPDLVAKALGSL